MSRPKLTQLLDQLRSAIATSLPRPILLGAIVLSMSLIERGREILMASSLKSANFADLARRFGPRSAASMIVRNSSGVNGGGDAQGR
jgi:hypothetical protein